LRITVWTDDARDTGPDSAVSRHGGRRRAPPSEREGLIVARTRSEAELLVIFSRDGEKDEATIVADGERAAKVAVLMIAGCGTLHAGDQLLVQQYDEA
jgi:hypothetical protein